MIDDVITSKERSVHNIKLTGTESVQYFPEEYFDFNK